MDLRDRLIDIRAHLHCALRCADLDITDDITRDHLRDAFVEVEAALDELRHAASRALVETFPHAEAAQ